MDFDSTKSFKFLLQIHEMCDFFLLQKESIFLKPYVETSMKLYFNTKNLKLSSNFTTLLVDVKNVIFFLSFFLTFFGESPQV